MILDRDKATLTADQRASYHDRGFLILPGFMDSRIIDDVNAEIVDLTTGGAGKYPNVTVDVIHPPRVGRRSITEVELEDFKGPVKINDLFLVSEIVRRCNQNGRLLGVLKQLLDGDPIICNSLNFIYGSQQPPHFDTWYMPPPVENAMAVASICLDDMTEENGPLVYYPDSHKLPPYHFSHGALHAVNEEMPACEAYVSEKVTAAGLKPELFYGKRGDVFIWHAQLYHGGMPIKDPSKTRRSLVTHYWRSCDVPPERVLNTGYGYTLDR